MECRKVELIDGVYKFCSDTVEDWENVLSSCDKYEHVTKLIDQAPYTECYKVFVGTQQYTYFVEMLQW